jgi:PAS domain S-box-containing protein
MKLGFRSKIYLGSLSLLLLLGMVIFLLVSRTMEEALLEESRNRGISVTSNLAARVTEPILVMDFLRLKNLVDETVELSDDIYYTFILGAEGETLVHTFKGGFPVELKAANTVLDSQKYNRNLLDTGDHLVHDFAVPVFAGKDRLGTVRVGLLQTRVQQAINRLLWTTFLSTAFVIAIAGFVGTALARTVTRRIRILHQSSEKAMRGDLEVQTAPLLKRNCWDIMNCSKKQCPAYGELSLRCWYLAGTLCPHCVEGEYAKKIASCRQCPVYKECSGDEIQSLAESFDSMARTLKNQLSELSATQVNLTEQRQLLKTVLDATPDFVTLQDGDSIYRAVNKAFCELVRKPEEEIIGKTDFDLFSRQQAEMNRQEDLAIFQSGEALVKEYKIRTGSDKRWLHVMKLPVRDGNGKIVGLLCSGRDITEFKQVQERLTQAQKMEGLGQLTAGIAHEINTPLGIILGYAQLLLEDAEAESQLEEDLKMVEKHAHICRKIVSDLLRFSRHTESSMASLNVNDMIEEVLSVVEHTFSLERIVLVRRFDPNLPTIVGDKEKLNQAIMNLVNNGFDAIGTDGVVAIATSFGPKDNEVVISVADTGCGIPPENTDRIFDPFFTTKGVGKGTGLGLSVTFGIIKDHGGRIEVRSPAPAGTFAIPDLRPPEVDGKGTVFTIYLPVDRNPDNDGGELTHGDYFGTG